MKLIAASALILVLSTNLGAAQAQTQTPAAKPAGGGSVANQLAACKNKASWNVIKREQCVWSLCKGRWGRDGCPPPDKDRPAGK